MRACDWSTGEAAAIGNDIAKARQTFFLRKVGQVKYPSSLGACIAISGLIECQQ